MLLHYLTNRATTIAKITSIVINFDLPLASIKENFQHPINSPASEDHPKKQDVVRVIINRF